MNHDSCRTPEPYEASPIGKADAYQRTAPIGSSCLSTPEHQQALGERPLTPDTANLLQRALASSGSAVLNRLTLSNSLQPLQGALAHAPAAAAAVPNVTLLVPRSAAKVNPVPSSADGDSTVPCSAGGDSMIASSPIGASMVPSSRLHNTGRVQNQLTDAEKQQACQPPSLGQHQQGTARQPMIGAQSSIGQMQPRAGQQGQRAQELQQRAGQEEAKAEQQVQRTGQQQHVALQNAGTKQEAQAMRQHAASSSAACSNAEPSVKLIADASVQSAAGRSSSTPQASVVGSHIVSGYVTTEVSP